MNIPISGKPFVLVVGGALMLDSAADQLHKALNHFDVNVLDTVRYLSPIPR